MHNVISLANIALKKLIFVWGGLGKIGQNLLENLHWLHTHKILSPASFFQPESEECNEMVFCDGCDICVHQVNLY